MAQPMEQKSLYENCIKYSEPQDSTEFDAYIKTTRKWHEYLEQYVNDEPYISYNLNPSEFIEPGNSDDWKYTMSDNTIYRQTPPLTVEQEKVLRAHCLRFLDPLNYFLTPTSNKFLCTNSKNIGEHPSLTKYMKVRNAIRYGNIYEEFLKSCDAAPLEEFDYKAFLDHEEPLITFGTNKKSKSRLTNKNKSIQKKGTSSISNSQLMRP